MAMYGQTYIYEYSFRIALAGMRIISSSQLQPLSSVKNVILKVEAHVYY